MSDLKPCSVCGSVSEQVYNLDGESIYQCANKDCHNHLYYMYENEWQSRPIEDALQARIKKQVKRIVILKKALRELYDACIMADNLEELSAEVDGDILDHAKEALDE